MPDDGVDDLFSEYTSAGDAEIGNKHIGLGLAIVKKVINLHAGKVMAAQSPILKGARFTMVFPRYSHYE